MSNVVFMVYNIARLVMWIGVYTLLCFLIIKYITNLYKINMWVFLIGIFLSQGMQRSIDFSYIKVELLITLSYTAFVK